MVIPFFALDSDASFSYGPIDVQQLTISGPITPDCGKNNRRIRTARAAVFLRTVTPA
jgi:hypothetical protein